ncbi:MAG TPA: FkbM family methyltransferase [Caulobacteraceae bacterium]|nr:FkbM family methyltransferase [Caulobacteraceae bacterium]
MPASWHLRYLVARERRRGERELALLPELAAPDRLAVDVGANKGVWTAALCDLGVSVHAFEPNPKIFAELHRALRSRAVLHPLALSDRAGIAEFRVPRSRRGYSNQGGSLSAVAVRGLYGATQVETARLDDLGLVNVGFIKIDVEGAEMAVLQGARQVLARDRPNLVIEMEERHIGRPLEQALAEVEALGYAGYALAEGVLTPWRDIDLDARHRRPASRDLYLFNFVFRPHRPSPPRWPSRS